VGFGAGSGGIFAWACAARDHRRLGRGNFSANGEREPSGHGRYVEGYSIGRNRRLGNWPIGNRPIGNRPIGNWPIGNTGAHADRVAKSRVDEQRRQHDNSAAPQALSRFELGCDCEDSDFATHDFASHSCAHGQRSACGDRAAAGNDFRSVSNFNNKGRNLK
jgi:hypothetical protein